MSTFGKIGARDLLYGKGVPRGYTEHDALYVTGDAEHRYIDTGIRPAEFGNFAVDFNYIGKANTGSGYMCIGTIAKNIKTPIGLGAFFVPIYRDVHVTSGDNDYKYKTIDAIPLIDVSFTFGVLSGKRYFHLTKLSNGVEATYYWDIDGNERGTPESTFLIGVKRNWWDNCSGTILGKCKITFNGKAIWEGIPCSRNSDGIPGYWDVVSKKFFPGNYGFKVYDDKSIAILTNFNGGGKCIELSESAFYAYSSDSFWKEAA